MESFISSGTTAEAVIQQGREYIGIEIDQHYVQVVRERTRETQIKLPVVAEQEPCYDSKPECVPDED